MTARDLQAAMRAHDRLVAMLDDPHCGGDTLLVGLALLAKIDLKRRDTTGQLSSIGRLVYADTTRMHGWRVKDALLRDIRTYKPDPGCHDDPCEAPMIRRAGYCGRREGGGHVTLQDWNTGERRPLAHCARHRDWAHDVWRANRAEAPQPDQQWGGAPLPAANHGGVLARHFPEIDWPAYWRKLDPRWVEHPEGAPRPTPMFTLVVGDSNGTAAGGDAAVLTLIPSGCNT